MEKSVYDADNTVANAGGIVNYVDENGGKIDHIQVNGTEQTITDKTVNIPVPTELADLDEDATHRVVTDSEKSAWNAKVNLDSDSTIAFTLGYDAGGLYYITD